MKYDEISCKKILQSACEYTNEILRDERINIKFDFEIVKCERFNANTTLLKNGEYYIKINDEVFKKIFDVLNILLYKENDDFYKLISSDNEYNEEKVMWYYLILLELMGKLVFYHEMGHIVNGHLRYMSSKNQNDNSSMFMNSNSNKFPCLESQALEMDADAFSATMLIRQITYSENLEQYPNIIKGKEHGLFLLIIAANLLFAIQGLMYERITDNIKEMSYLPLKTRMDYYIRCTLNAYNCYNDAIQYDINEFRKIYPIISAYIELLNNELWMYNNLDYKYESLDLECLEHCDFLDEFWSNVMREKLLPYSYGSLAL